MTTPKKKTAVKRAPAKKKPAARERPSMASTGAPTPAIDVARQIEARFVEIGGWRGATLATLRALILQADPALLEERKWIKPSNPFGVPTYSREGLVLTLEVYKSAVKVTFARGAQVPDPTGIFNASLLGARRAVDVHEGEAVAPEAFRALVRAAVGVNLAKRAR